MIVTPLPMVTEERGATIGNTITEGGDVVGDDDGVREVQLASTSYPMLVTLSVGHREREVQEQNAQPRCF